MNDNWTTLQRQSKNCGGRVTNQKEKESGSKREASTVKGDKIDTSINGQTARPWMEIQTGKYQDT